MDKPLHALDDVYTLMQDCWLEEPKDRPVKIPFEALKVETIIWIYSQSFGELEQRFKRVLQEASIVNKT